MLIGSLPKVEDEEEIDTNDYIGAGQDINDTFVKDDDYKETIVDQNEMERNKNHEYVIGTKVNEDIANIDTNGFIGDDGDDAFIKGNRSRI